MANLGVNKEKRNFNRDKKYKPFVWEYNEYKPNFQSIIDDGAFYIHEWKILGCKIDFSDSHNHILHILGKCFDGWNITHSYSTLNDYTLRFKTILGDWVYLNRNDHTYFIE